jgi:DEAD/DEAH box helicase domain-containing protein
MDVEAVIRELTNAPGYEGQIIHIERVPAREAQYVKSKLKLPYAVERALRETGIERLYSHQTKALETLDAERNIVLVSGPASGKSLAYQLPILNRLLDHPADRSLLLFPTKALAQDQLRSFERLASNIRGLRAQMGVLDGDTPSDLRRKLRQSGRILLTNPDFLHSAILAQHNHWATFFEHLRFIVVDEIHTYSGLFGSNVGNLFRRFWRVLDHYGAKPQIVACSATIANPRELAERVIGREMVLIDEDGSPSGAKTYVLWNPPKDRAVGRYQRRSANVEAHRIAARLIAGRVPTIVFSKARVTAELLYRYIREELERMGSPLSTRVAPYRGGYLPEERREIEQRLFNGDLLGVSTTPALELGIDVGPLEASLIVGYPGRRASFFQQAGRAGRRERDSLVVLIFIDTAINQWIAQHPEYIFGRPIEEGVVDLDNPHIVAGHLRCAAAELPLAASEEGLFGPHAREALEVLQERRKVKLLGERWYHTASEVPQHELSLRAMSDANVVIVDARDHNTVIGEVDRYDSYALVHPGAIYMHLGETYEVERLDLERNIASVKKVEVDYYTQPIGGCDVDHIDKPLRSRPFGVGRACVGEVTAYCNTYAYEKIRWYTLEAVSQHPVTLPVATLETLSFWIEAPEDLMKDVYARGLDGFAGLRGIGYATRMVLPLFVNAETLDFSHSVGSRNSAWHTVFVFERHPCGLGFVEKAYEHLENIIRAVYERVRGCDCADGCPECVGKPLRESTSWNIERGEGSIPSRRVALSILEGLLGKRAIEITAAEIQPPPKPEEIESTRVPAGERGLPPNVEQAIRRRLERMREPPQQLHRVEPAPKTGYSRPSQREPLMTPDAARRAQRRIETDRRRRKESADQQQRLPEPNTPQHSSPQRRDPTVKEGTERRERRHTPKLPAKLDAAIPPEPLPEVGPRNIASQAEDMRRQMLIASQARRRAREKKEEK